MKIYRLFRHFLAKIVNRKKKKRSSSSKTTTITTTSHHHQHHHHRQTRSATKPKLPNFQICQFWLIVANLLLILHPINADWLMDCGSCHCKWNSGKKTADCKNLSFSEVPENLSPHIQVLDLSHNQIPYLPPNAFLHAQLHNLHKLYIRNASLQQIDKRSFAQLEILIELDLSHNLLTSLQVNQFAHLVKVRALLLNNNLIETLGNGVFQHLKFLHRLELKCNRLSHIAAEVFVNLPILSQIYLDENQLSFLHKTTFEHLKRLTALSLDQNPWNCTCELEIFRNFVVQRNLYTPPTACFYPIQLRGMLWIENQPEAFACKPKIVEPTRDGGGAGGITITAIANENVTLVCRVHASMNTHIVWHHNKQLIRSNINTNANTNANTNNQRVHIQLLRDGKTKTEVQENGGGKSNDNGGGSGSGGRHFFTSLLTISATSRRDEGAYTCLAENAGGQDAVQMSLVVQNTTANALWFSFQGNLLIVVCLLALSLLSITFFATMIFCCLYKRYKLGYNGGSSSGSGLSGGAAQNQQQHQPRLDIQLTMAGNVVVDSTSINAASIESSSNESAKTASPVGSHYHLVRENTNSNSNANSNRNKTTKKFTACLLQENIMANHHHHQTGGNTQQKNGGNGSPLRHYTKDSAQFQAFNDISAQNANRLKDKLISNSSTTQKEFNAVVVDFQPDLLSAYNVTSNNSNNKMSGKVNS